jgi:hypothetical protein
MLAIKVEFVGKKLMVKSFQLGGDGDGYEKMHLRKKGGQIFVFDKSDKM